MQRKMLLKVIFEIKCKEYYVLSFAQIFKVDSVLFSKTIS